MCDKWIPIEFKRKGKTVSYWLSYDRRQWTLARYKTIDKDGEDNYNGRSYYSRIDYLFNELMEEIPRRYKPETMDEILHTMIDAREWLRKTLYPFVNVIAASLADADGKS